MKRIRFFLLLIIFSALTANASAQTSDRQKTASLLNEYLKRMEAFGFGGAVLIEREGRIIFNKGYGWANLNERIPFSPETPFPVQSISKQFTAASVLKLEERGKLRIEDPIGRFFKDAPEDKKAITVHQLLTHTSGFGDNYAGSGIFSRDEAVRAILRQPLDNPPGKKMIYSNDGYELLAAIVETVSGENLADFVRRNFFIPAEMKTAGFQGDGDFWKNETVAHAYNGFFDNGSPQNVRRDWDGYGSGDIVMSVEDLFNWELALRQNRVLSEAMKKKMFSPYASFRENWDYGYGWFIIKSENEPVRYYHGGGDVPRGYTASFTRYPEEKMTIIILSNTMTDEMGFLRAVKPDIENIVFGQTFEMPPAVASNAPFELKKYAGIYRTEGGEGFVLEFRDERLLIGALDQKAVDFLTTPDEETSRDLVKYDRLAADFVEKVIRNESGAPSAQTAFDDLKNRYGDFKGFEVLGTGPVSFSPRISTTFVKLNFAKGAEVVRFVRRGDGTPYQLLGTPYPAMTPVMPGPESDKFSAYYPFLQKKISLRFEFGQDKEIKALSLDNGKSVLSARKL
ncbi:MAG: serine hydrolase domain-containing protein [Pyrinomonadaceae bacterium]